MGKGQTHQGDVNPDLVKERLDCPFDQEEVTNLLDGSREKTEKRRSLEKFILSAKGLVDKETVLESLSAEERYDYDLRKSVQLFNLTKAYSGGTTSVETLRETLGGGVSGCCLPDGNPLILHYAMFLPTIVGQGTLEQQVKWLDKAWNLEIMGTYAQTELGHGTFLRGLETTATYDPSSREFVLHTPSLSALKWWPGGLGKTADHAVVMAQLVTADGVRRGPHAFLVQLRDRDTHRTLKGIKLGEIGPKLGMVSADNGFLGFDQYRIPRENMLMRNSQVLEDGTYVKPVKAQLNYGTMVMVRCAIAVDVTRMFKKAVAIAVRYSAVRRQSELIPGEPEPQVLDYQTQQLKLFPALALCFGFTFAAQKLWSDYEENIQLQDEGDLSRLPELHALSCGMKALVTAEAAEQVDVVRRACGGHGFMASSNLPRLWGLITAACTYEGENTVMLLQAARHLVKTEEQRSSAPPPPSAVPPNPGLTDNLGLLFDAMARGKTAHAIRKLRKEEEEAARRTPGGSPASASALAWNAASSALAEAAEAGARAFVVARFEEKMRSESAAMSKGVREVLWRLCRLMAVSWMLEKHKGDFVVYAGVTPRDLDTLEKTRNRLLSEIRPVAVCIVDAFDFSDDLIRSTIGSYDGRAYERLYEAALRGPLNKRDVALGFNKYVKPMTKASL